MSLNPGGRAVLQHVPPVLGEMPVAGRLNECRREFFEPDEADPAGQEA